MALPTYDDVLALLKQGAVVEAQEHFNALHEKALMLQQENSRRHDRILIAEAERGRRVEIEPDGIACYQVENGKKIGPFCQRCYDTEAKLVRLSAKDAATYICSACKTECARNLCG